jgi:tRNA pseudouridine32 synthase/23S rRNA pseudouridine746 synthase
MTEQGIELERHLPIEQDGNTAIELLNADTGLTRQGIKQAMHKGAVWLTHNRHTRRLRRATRTLSQGDTLHLYYNERILSMTPPAAQLIADVTDYSVWYKPCGMYSQGSKWGDHCTINRWAEQHLQPQRPAFIVHRLDSAATGLILIAHKKQIAAALAKLFQERQLNKVYRVIVAGHFPDQTQTIDSSIDGRSASSSATLIRFDSDQQRSLLEVNIDTGRKHQIRRHLSELGFPVVGDRLYGNNEDSVDLQLTACSLTFVCPVSGEQKIFSLNEEMLPHL